MDTPVINEATFIRSIENVSSPAERQALIERFKSCVTDEERLACYRSAREGSVVGKSQTKLAAIRHTR